MSETIIENVKKQLWKKKPHVTKEYLLACIVEELQEMNKTLVEIKKWMR